MPKKSAKIGKKVESKLKEYLEKIAIIPKSFPIFSKDLRLMKSGKQSGIDLNWDLNFNLGGPDYKWYFESKGFGMSDYRNSKKYQNFTLSLISDKLLQLLGRTDLNIDCWCLFIPYARLDETDKIEIAHIQNHLPFKLCIWDVDFLFHRIKLIHPELFNTIYFKHKIKINAASSVVNNLDNYVWEIIEDTLEGYFTRKIHEKYRLLKRELEARCNREIIFGKDLGKGLGEGQKEGKGYFFQYQGANYYVPEEHLKNAIREAEKISLEKNQGFGDIKGASLGNMLGGNYKINDLIQIFENALCGGKSLYQMLQEYLNDPDILFARISVVFKIRDFSNLSFSKLDSSIHFGTTDNKDLLFKVIKAYK